MKTAFAVVAWLGVSSALGALFPTPLHLVRRIEDPISRTTTTLDEYCSGDRIVTVSGSRVAIADYGDGHVAFHYVIGSQGIVDSEYKTIRRLQDPKP